MANEILLYEDIGAGESTAKAIVEALGALKAGEAITVAIYSYGGNIFEAEAIYSALKRYKGRVTVRIDGVAASAASYIAMAADEIVMAPGAHMMIHRPSVSGFMSANEDDLRDILERFDVLTKQMVRVYAQRSGQDEAKIREMMEKETWLTAEQCAQLGFCDRIDDDLELQMAAANDIGRFRYRHVPVAVKAMIQAAKDQAAKTPEKKPDDKAKPQLSDNELEVRRERRALWKRRQIAIAKVRMPDKATA